MDSRKMKTMDGNNAAAYVSYAFTDVAAIYPITPSSVMADVADKYAAADQKNLFGRKVQISELQSEGGASGAVHGSLAAGALTTTYTASQGLLLMIPNMYKIAGEFLPAVMHVSARSLSTQALCIFGDHSDIYACRQTGFSMLCSCSTQECMDLGAVAHLSAIQGSMPVMHFFDGFRTSHEIQKIHIWDYKDLGDMLDWDAVDRFRRNAMNPEHPVTKGTSENDDLFFQVNEASNSHYDAFPEVVVENMNKVNAKIGTDYKPFNYCGAPDATEIIIAMGSVCECAEEVINYLNAKGGKVGLVKVRLYRPFVAKYLLDVIPDTVKKISVLDRTKERGSIGEPLYLDVIAALKDSKFNDIPVYSGRYGLGSKDTNPGQIVAVYSNMQSNTPKKRFTIGITDDVTNLSLEVKENPDTTAEGTHSCKFWGLGADGTVGANKNSIKIIGDHTDMYAQGYFAYDSKKSGGLTISHLRFGKKPIQSTYYITKADFVACHKPSYVDIYDMVEDLKPGGNFLLNCQWDLDELDKKLPGKMKKYIADNNINFYTIDGIKLGKEIGLGGRINTILQSAFFAIADIIPKEDAIKYLKDAATKTYGRKGEKIVAMNHAAIDRGANEYVKVKVPASWKNCTDDSKPAVATKGKPEVLEYVNNVLLPANRHMGDTLPVSTVMKMADGTVPSGSSAYEKRGIAIDVPEWNPDNCIQCNQCSYVCPHAVIRPVVMTEEEAAKAPKSMKMKDMTLMKGYKFAMTISTLDCTGCGSCATVCPGMKGNKALTMKPMETQMPNEEGFNYGLTLKEKPEVAQKFKPTTVKGSQFRKPLLEFSGACAGCGETPYAKLITQLFGDRMYIANATGCSSIWGASAPATPYTVNEKGYGPAWNNSLFEDNAEFGYGMALAQDAIRGRLSEYVENIEAQSGDEALKAACKAYLDTAKDSGANREATDKLITELEKAAKGSGDVAELAKKTLKDKDYLAKKSMWIFGGDGWAYDIGYGGLDHVLASGENVNVFVFDTEVYSNTGGQASKSTPMGSVAQFAATGKATKKKDLPGMAMTYGYVYVAHVAMGADYNQCIKAIAEAESYDGPSLIIGYAPCINQGIKGGMSIAMLEEKKAVAAGYWKNFRYDPRLALDGKNPLQLDSKAPSASYRDFIMGEVRYNSLTRAFPDRAEKLFTKAEEDAMADYAHLEKMSKL